MSAGGFTEDDQLRIAEEVAGRVGAKRVGLGFGGGGRIAETPKTSTQSSAWFEQAQSATTEQQQQQSFVGDGNQDTTEGAFPWDGGQRGKAGGTGRKKEGAVGNVAARVADKSDRPTVREFPMVRDRDIERSEAGRGGEGRRRSRSKSRGRGTSRSRSRDRSKEKKSRRGRSRSKSRSGRRNKSRSRSRNRRRSKSRSRSRRRSKSRSGRRSKSRSRGRRRSKSRSRSRSRDRYRDSRRGSRAETESGRDRQQERERQRERERERERRGREKERERERKRAAESRRSRDGSREKDRHQQRKGRRSHSPNSANRNRSGTDDASRPRQVRSVELGRTPADRPPPEELKSSLPTAAQAKAAVKRRLRQVVAGDVALKTGAKASVGGVASWERPEMSAASDFFKSDEVAAKGGVASVAPEYEARLAKILAVEDEDTICLADGMEKTQAGAGAGIAGSMNFDPSTKMHHDAIFAPTGQAAQPAAVCAAPAPASVMAGVMGAAARARLVLTGKVGEEPTTPKSPPTKTSTKTKAKKTEKLSQPRKDEGEQPLFKSLRAGESVEARYTDDDKWYKAVILQVIHGGFEIARYKVRYSEYGNEETVSWTRIRRLESAEGVAASEEQTTVEATAVDPFNFPSTGDRSVHNETAPPTDGESKPFAGMRPRSLCVVKNSPRQEPEEKVDSSTPAESADVVNPVIRSATPGRKMSWKEKLQARKAGANESAGADGVRILPKKQISLVPDFLGQRKEQEGERMLDKSEWRSKVVFGMGGGKKTSR